MDSFTNRIDLTDNLPTRLAVVDIGSNAIRLLGVESSLFDQDELLRKRYQIRLGQDVFAKGVISEELMEEFVDAFSDIQRQMELHKIDCYWAVATSALREAANADEACKRVFDRTGLKIEVINGRQEALLIHEAMRAKFKFSSSHYLMGDLGGGSFDFVHRSSSKERAFSLELGAVRMMKLGVEIFPKIAEAFESERSFFMQFLKSLKNGPNAQLILTGGNARALLRLQKRILGKTNCQDRLLRESLEQLVKTLDQMSDQEKVDQVGLRSDRADVVVPAAIIYLELMNHLNFERAFVPSVSLKHGIIREALRGGGHSICR